VRASTAAPAGDTVQLNPEGCWDFWGYTDTDGALAAAARPQLRAMKAMAGALVGAR